jgi:hypothetical protein
LNIPPRRKNNTSEQAASEASAKNSLQLTKTVHPEKSWVFRRFSPKTKQKLLFSSFFTPPERTQHQHNNAKQIRVQQNSRPLDGRR